MATRTWRGDAQAVAQVTTITIGGTAGAGDTVKITCNLKDVTITLAGGETTTQVAAALYAALIDAQPSIPEYSRVIFSTDTNVVTLTARDAGYPFTISRTVTGTITATLATPTASSGPNQFDAADNWGGTNPTTNDSIIIPPDAPAYPMFGLDAFAAVDLGTGTIHWLGGSGGLPDQNPDGYAEYRAKKVQFGGCAAINIGDGVNGTTFLRLDVAGSATIPTKIDNGQALSASATNPGIFLTSGGTANLTVSVVSGSVAIATGTGDVAIATLAVGTGGPPGSVGASDEAAAAWIGAGATIATTTLNAGEILAEASTALTLLGGVYTQRSGNIAAVTNRGGTLIFNGPGTMGAYTGVGMDSLLDMSGDVRAIGSITSLSVTQGAYFLDPQGRIPTGTGVTMDHISYPRCVWKTGTMTMTRT